MIKGLALVEGAVGILNEEHRHLVLFQDDFLTTQTLANATQGYNLHQFLAHMGHFTKAVYQVGAIGSQLFVCLQAIQFTIQQHTF